MDVYLVQGGPLASRGNKPLPSDRLFRNLGEPGRLAFEDATLAAGIDAPGYGMGIATADVDNDGDVDVLVTNLGRNRLLLNNGGRFIEAVGSGLDDDAWSLSASFADFDQDGLLDVYVTNYLAVALGDHDAPAGQSPLPRCGTAQRDYCPPARYPPAADRLYRNLGNGRFEVATGALAATQRRPGMGVVADDFNADGWPDFFVANDGTANNLWLNQGGTFVDAAHAAGVALNGDGEAEASMGVAVADFDGDGWPDLHVTHDRGESNTLYRYLGLRAALGAVGRGAAMRPIFEDASSAAGVAAGSLPRTGFGTGWFDADNDGDLDLFVANGAVDFGGRLPGTGLRQRNQLWLLGSDGRYRLAATSTSLGEGVSRGAAFGDLDNDGDIDVVVANNHGRAQLLRNDSPKAHWVGLDLRNGHGSPAIGARVRLDEAGVPSPWRSVRTDGSYASAQDPRLLFGRGRVAAQVAVVVVWPSGATERFGPLATGRYHMLRQGAPR